MTGGTASGSSSEPNSQVEVNISINDAYNLVPCFDGNPEALNKFIACGNILFSSTKSEGHSKLFLEVVKTRLQGPAFELIQYKSIASWSELTTELESHFKNDKSRSTVHNELIATKQRHKETVKEFGDRLNTLLTALDSATHSSVDDANVRKYLLAENTVLAVQVFEDGIRDPTLKLLVKARGEKDLRRAIAFASEQAVRLDRNNFPPPAVSRPPMRSICQICGKEGHTRERCFKNASLPRYPTKFDKSSVQRLTCTYCNKPNHSYEECRQRINRNRQSMSHAHTPRNYDTRNDQRRRQENFGSLNQPRPVRDNHNIHYTPGSGPDQPSSQPRMGNGHPRGEDIGNSSRVAFTADTHQQRNGLTRRTRK